MKYTRMLCWVRPHEKKELVETIGDKFPIIFAKSYDDFCSKINEDDYLLFSIVKAAKNFKKCKLLVNKFPQFMFHLYFRDNGVITNNELDMFLEKNVEGGQQTYLSILDSLGIAST